MEEQVIASKYTQINCQLVILKGSSLVILTSKDIAVNGVLG